MRRLRILHISDLHEKAGREREPWRRRRVLGDMWLRNLDEIAAEDPVDLIAFTGDAAHSGKLDEFARVTDFLNATRERLEIPPERLFVIPGNHDVDRTVQPECWIELRKALGNTVDLLSVGRWMAGANAPPGFKAEWRNQVQERLANYRKWVAESLSRPELAEAEGTLGYRVTLEGLGAGYPVHILGLNTAWMCGDENDSGKLWLLEEQLMRIASTAAGAPHSGLRILLMHHPLEHMADGSSCRRLMPEYVDLVLRGHLHEEEAGTWTDPDDSVRQLAAGSLYEGWRADQWPNAYHLITITSDDVTNRPSTAEARFRVWSGRSGSWHDDHGLYREIPNGRLIWQISSPSSEKEQETPSAADPWKPAVPPVFVGRDTLLRKIRDAWDQGRSVSLVGDWRIGKTSILATCYMELGKSGRPVRLLNGESREGATPSDFVRAATGTAIVPSDTDGAADLLAAWARQLRRPGLLPLILVDECDALVRRFEYRFFERLRGMLDDICLGVSSRRELDRVFLDSGKGTSPFQNRLELHWVGLLEKDASEKLLGLAGGRLTAPAKAMVREWAGRHPFFIQLIIRKLLDAKRFNQSETEACDEFRTEAAARLRELWGTLSERDRTLLIQAANLPQAQARSLRQRGLLDDAGRHFGRVLSEWLAEEVAT